MLHWRLLRLPATDVRKYENVRQFETLTNPTGSGGRCHVEDVSVLDINLNNIFAALALCKSPTGRVNTGVLISL
jgi:hypothetical protein